MTENGRDLRRPVRSSPPEHKVLLSVRISKFSTVLPLGVAQIIAWASSYYLLAILAAPIAQDTNMPVAAVFGAFSGALLIAALIGPLAGKTIDRIGGRPVLAASSILFAAGLGLLAAAQAWPLVCLAWLCLGLGMGLGLYDAAFAALGRLYGTAARAPITGITLMAGFASTIGWPLTFWALKNFGWREACFGWAIAHLVIGLPLNLTLPRAARASARESAGTAPRLTMDRTMWLLAFAFAAGWTISTAMAAHLPRLLEARGASESQALLAGMLIGPAQVAARIVEAAALKRYHPLLSARLSAVLHPIGAGLLALGAGAVPAFALLHGAGNGILTIARGTVPLAIYGPVNYGYRLGLLGAPARVAQAAAPLLFGVLIDALGTGALLISAALGASTFCAFCMIRVSAHPGAS
jgi:predicted MFS family arabinose efflux permease